MPSSAKKPIFQFKITLRDIEPAIWRRIQVPGRYTFWDLHVAIQDSMGWLDCHLHAFELCNAEGTLVEAVGIPDDDWGSVKTVPGWEVKIAERYTGPGVSIRYLYDFGDDWAHDVVLEEILAAEPGQRYPRCVAGERACPPEDCGGAHGYQNVIEILRSSKHAEYRSTVAWLKGHARNYHPYDPGHFDPQAVRFDDPRKRWKRAFEEGDTRG